MTYLKHKDIYTKFMIEYDKANVTSSYPSLTEYEVATFLDKAYNALIAQKVTGNNVRRASFEADTKAISDLQGLVVQSEKDLTNVGDQLNVVKTDLPTDFLYLIDCYAFKPEQLKPDAVNASTITSAQIVFNSNIRNGGRQPGVILPSGFKGAIMTPTDSGWHDRVVIPFESLPTQIDPRNLQAFKDSGILIAATNPDGNYVDEYSSDSVHGAYDYDFPWSGSSNLQYAELLITTSAGIAKCPATAYNEVDVDDDTVTWTGWKFDLSDARYIGEEFEDAYDERHTRPYMTKVIDHNTARKFFISAHNMPWVKNLMCYVEDNKLYIIHDSKDSFDQGTTSITYIKKPNTFVKDLSTPAAGYVSYFVGTASAYDFECNDTVAEELVSLAITFALENVESQRLNSKLNTRGLEA